VRRIYLIAIAAAVVLFLVISALLARVLSANSAEQSAITALVKDEARGDAAAIIGDITGCRAEPACTRRARQLAGALTRQGKVSIIQLQPSTNFSVAGTQGTARVAWNVGSSLPIVQCVRVHRSGNAVSGLRVQLLEVSPRIKSDTACPARF
jgi:hypothetical protein